MPDEYVPYNVHSDKKFICSVCGKLANGPGASFIDEYSICRCCRKDLAIKLKELKEEDMPEHLFNYSNGNRHFSPNSWLISEVEKVTHQTQGK